MCCARLGLRCACACACVWHTRQGRVRARRPRRGNRAGGRHPHTHTPRGGPTHLLLQPHVCAHLRTQSRERRLALGGGRQRRAEAQRGAVFGQHARPPRGRPQRRRHAARPAPCAGPPKERHGGPSPLRPSLSCALNQWRPCVLRVGSVSSACARARVGGGGVEWGAGVGTGGEGSCVCYVAREQGMRETMRKKFWPVPCTPVLIAQPHSATARGPRAGARAGARPREALLAGGAGLML